jgi:hypothetical protein
VRRSAGGRWRSSASASSPSPERDWDRPAPRPAASVASSGPQALGYENLEDFYRSRYVGERARLEQLAAELGCAESAVRGDLRRLALGPDRSRSHGARWRERT